jgi:hypothetical protein
MLISDYQNLPDFLVLHRNGVNPEEKISTLPDVMKECLFNVEFDYDDTFESLTLTSKMAQQLQMTCTSLELYDVLKHPHGIIEFIETVDMKSITAIAFAAASSRVHRVRISLYKSSGGVVAYTFDWKIRFTEVSTNLDGASTRLLRWKVSFVTE